MVAVIDSVFVLRRCPTKVVYYSWPFDCIDVRHSINSLSIMSLEWSLSMSVLSSSNGFPMFSITSSSELSCLENSLLVASVCSWWFIWLVLSLWILQTYSEMTQMISGPATAHRKRALASCVSPIVPPSSFITQLFCSWPWSVAIKENFLWDLANTNLPFRNSWATSGCCIEATQYLLHEQTSIGSSECGLDWRTKVSAWLVCLRTNQSLLYAKNAQMPTLAVPVQGSCTSKGTEDAYCSIVYTSSWNSLWNLEGGYAFLRRICNAQAITWWACQIQVTCFFCVYHVSKRNLGSLANNKIKPCAQVNDASMTI